MLIENVRHHVEEEEHEFFPMVRDELGRNALGDLGDAMATAKKAAPTHPHPRSPDTPPGNLVVGPAAGIADRVGDTVSGVAQGSVTAVNDLVARILGRKRPIGLTAWFVLRPPHRRPGPGRSWRRPPTTPSPRSPMRKRSTEDAATTAMKAGKATATNAERALRSTATAAKAGTKGTATSARKGASRTATTAKRAATTTGRTARARAKKTATAAKRAAS